MQRQAPGDTLYTSPPFRIPDTILPGTNIIVRTDNPIGPDAAATLILERHGLGERRAPCTHSDFG